MAAWLGRQKKSELLALAERAGLGEDELEKFRKDEVALVLHEHFQKNASRLAGDAAFQDYYGRSSPTKRSSGATAAATSEGEIKPKKKRAPKVKEETDGEAASPSSPAPAVTPAPARSLAPARTPSAATHGILKTIPPSPAVITDAIEAQARKFSTSLDKALVRANARDYLNDTREVLSSVVGIETLILLIEGFSLQRQLIPFRYGFSIPAIDALGTNAYPVHLPDFFIILTDVFWSTTTLWTLMSFWLPLALSWLFNLTMRPVVKGGVTSIKPRWRCDPLTFNVSKALISWLVFTQGARFFGLYSDETVLTVLRSMPAGQTGITISAAIGALASLYDAAQRK
ncbi:hypothetical protein CAC42_3341 [Sphaceloma murrayae]|uniref:Uncharacterized protein n=1 Tax=Sphaceloma murrayae TaxID=2082308 RepID=A0A2K1R121_9PEZI|nr:hypothetical protein CAC42_3341 [Sphaceloma murrayae]